jgi:hypothetical protein
MPTAAGTCPPGCTGCKCNPEGTLIAGPAGNRRIETLVEGDLVYSMDRGRLATVGIRRVQRVAVHDHIMVRVVLAGGTVLRESPLHPTADGRTFAQLAPGETLDGLRIVETSLVPYSGSATWDLLPDSDSGTYFAGGVLIGSTLATGSVRLSTAVSPLCSGP